MAELRLEELSASNVVAANNLSLKPGQEQFITPVSYSAETAVLTPGAAWQRVVLQDDKVVGFIHGNFDPENEREEFRACIWRINVDAEAQGKGVGRNAALTASPSCGSRARPARRRSSTASASSTSARRSTATPSAPSRSPSPRMPAAHHAHP